MLSIEIPKIVLPGGRIGIMLIGEILKIEMNGGHIVIMLIIDITKNRTDRQPYWNYANYRYPK